MVNLTFLVSRNDLIIQCKVSIYYKFIKFDFKLLKVLSTKQITMKNNKKFIEGTLKLMSRLSIRRKSLRTQSQ